MKISRDPRYDQIELVDMKDAGARLFGDWSMGFASNPELIKELWGKIDVEGQFNPKLLEPYRFGAGDERFARRQG